MQVDSFPSRGRCVAHPPHQEADESSVFWANGYAGAMVVLGHFEEDSCVAAGNFPQLLIF
jgi:hypothetical protein